MLRIGIVFKTMLACGTRTPCLVFTQTSCFTTAYVVLHLPIHRMLCDCVHTVVIYIFVSMLMSSTAWQGRVFLYVYDLVSYECTCSSTHESFCINTHVLLWTYTSIYATHVSMWYRNNYYKTCVYVTLLLFLCIVSPRTCITWRMHRLEYTSMCVFLHTCVIYGFMCPFPSACVVSEKCMRVILDVYVVILYRC